MNGHLGRLVPALAGRIMPINNFILATTPLGAAGAHALIRDDVAVADSKFVIDYFRLSADRRLLFGGGESYTAQLPANLATIVERCMLKVFPQLAGVPIDYAWGGTLAITRSRLPHFARLAPEVFVAHGYSGQGIALATLAGKLIAEAIAGTAERFDVMADLKVPRFPGGTLLRWPALVLGMLYYGLRDRL
jgi:gamma-glutamylputrescine oxidase